MTDFSMIFGAEKESIRNNCLLLPIPVPGLLNALGLGKPARGALYQCVSNDLCTMIITGMGPAFAGDAALYLQDTSCKNIILFGSCGLLGRSSGLDIGDLVIPDSSFSIESFTSMLLTPDSEWRIAYPDKELTRALQKACHGPQVKEVSSATTGSLKLEASYIDRCREKNISVIDMESSAVFSASRYSGISVAALFYVSDIVGEKPFYAQRTQHDRIRIASSVKRSEEILCRLIKTLSAS